MELELRGPRDELYKQLYSFKPRYVLRPEPSLRKEAIGFLESVFGAVVGSVTSDCTELQLPDSTSFVILHESRPKCSDNASASASSLAEFKTDDVDIAIKKARDAGAMTLIANGSDQHILTDPFGLNFAWSYRLVKGQPVVQDTKHPPHVPALCSERLNWMTCDNNPHLEPHQLIRNRTCDLLLADLDERSLKLRKYQSEFDDGTDNQRVAFYTFPFSSCSSLSQLVSDMHRMIGVARWWEVVMCITPLLERWSVGSVQSKLLPSYDTLFGSLPSYRALPNRWWEVSKQLQMAAGEVVNLLSSLLQARSRLAAVHGGNVISDAFLMMEEVNDEIKFWKCKLEQRSEG